MDTVLIVAASLLILIAVAILLQTMDNNKKENRQREAALNSRVRNLDYMLNGFPEGFLHQELKVLVCHCLADVFSQLQAIDPKNQSYTNKLANAQRDAKEFSAQTAAQVSVTLSDRGQIREIQKMLGSLDNIVVTMASSKGIQPTEASHYRKIIQRLMLKTALDELINPIREAMDEGNTALAIHYLEAAKGKMEQANEDGFYSDQITQYTARIEALVQSPPNADAEPATAQPASEKDSESFSDSGDSWKKKNLYD